MNRSTKPVNSITPIVVIALSLVAGCSASSKTRLSDATLSGVPSAMWADGQRAVDSGESLINKGEKHLEDGRKLIRDGQARVDEGSKRVRLARQDYQRAAQSGGASVTPSEVATEAKRLRVIGKRWDEAIEYIKDGNKMVDRGNKSVTKGQSEIREGRLLMESGSTLIRNSQRMRLGDELLPLATKSQ